MRLGGPRSGQLTWTGQKDIPYNRASCSVYKLGGAVWKLLISSWGQAGWTTVLYIIYLFLLHLFRSLSFPLQLYLLFKLFLLLVLLVSAFISQPTRLTFSFQFSCFPRKEHITRNSYVVLSFPLGLNHDNKLTVITSPEICPLFLPYVFQAVTEPLPWKKQSFSGHQPFFLGLFLLGQPGPAKPAHIAS